MASAALPCAFQGSPPLNTDIAGVGVRISIYVQAVITIVYLSVSPDIEQVYNQSFPFIIMNISVMVAALVLGFSSNPQISLQDGVIAWFFTFIPLYVLLIAGHKLRNRNKLYNALKSSNWDLIPNTVALLIMYIFHAAFSLALFHHYETFGSHPECNSAARGYIFGTHAVTHRWFVGLAVAYGIFLCLLFIPVIYKSVLLVVVLSVMREPRNAEERKEAERQRRHLEKLAAEATAEADFEVDFLWGFIAFALLVIWIAFTEMTVRKNNFAPADSPAWQFGQIFPMILLAVPLLAAARAVSEFVQDTPEREEKMKRDPPPRVRAGLVATMDKLMNVPEGEDKDETDEKIEPTPPHEIV